MYGTTMMPMSDGMAESNVFKSVKARVGFI